jgi:membrane dipeptidase
MLVDTAHLGRQAFDELMTVATGPVINSHSCCRHLVDLERNVDDQQLKDIARSGGLVAVTFVPKFLASTGVVSSFDVFRHLEHMVELAGVDHVGIGSDFDGTEALPVDLRGSSDLVHVVEHMLRAGWSEDVIGKILGGNWQRVIRSIL